MAIASVGTPAMIRSWTFGIRVNLARTATGNLLEVWRRVRAGGVNIPQRGGVRPKTSPPLFLCSFSGAYSTGIWVSALVALIASPSYALCYDESRVLHAEGTRRRIFQFGGS